MGQTLKLEWQETASELKQRYRKERNSERQTRVYAFWQLRLGKTLKDVAELVGIGYRTLQHKRHTIEQHLRRLSHDKIGLEQLIGWQWIRQAFTTSPQDIAENITFLCSEAGRFITGAVLPFHFSS